MQGLVLVEEQIMVSLKASHSLSNVVASSKFVFYYIFSNILLYKCVSSKFILRCTCCGLTITLGFSNPSMHLK